MNPWLIISVIGIGTVLLRGSFLAILGPGSIPPALERALRFVPAAVFPAIALPAVLVVDGSYAIGFDNYRIYAAVVAGVVGYRTKNLSFTMVAGLATLWVLEGLF
ncbi:MAG: AzlD domain-containing protein [Acidimicrobiia bacterium]|nr:AzlD domain-containing protein [Acidimicrobiia bacterium]